MGVELPVACIFHLPETSDVTGYVAKGREHPQCIQPQVRTFVDPAAQIIAEPQIKVDVMV